MVLALCVSILMSLGTRSAIDSGWSWERTMNIGDVCTRDVYTARRDESLADAARAMRKRRIGALVVVETDDDLARAVGIVTDRDVVCGQVNRAADLFCLTVGDVMTADS